MYTLRTLIILFCSIIPVIGVDAQSPVNIWQGTAVHKKVLLTPFLAEGNNNPCIIVCPGGSYFWHDTQTEGVEVARWLQSEGISAFVLNYRTAYVPAFMFHTRLLFRGNQYPDPQNDLQKAIAFVKDHAEMYQVDTTKVGAMGFSAGGHLVMSVAEVYDSPRTRPDFVASIYPVVSFTAECTHKRSRRGLLGEYKKNKAKYRNALSLEKNVPEDCPPVFLMNCVDDPVVDFHNSILLDSALTAKNIRHKYIQYQTGGHGFGASNRKGTAECRMWKSEFIKWLQEVLIIKENSK